MRDATNDASEFDRRKPLSKEKKEEKAKASMREMHEIRDRINELIDREERRAILETKASFG